MNGHVTQWSSRADFTKGRTPSVVPGLAPGSNLSLLGQLSFYLKRFSLKESQLIPNLQHNHNGFIVFSDLLCAYQITTVVFCVF